MPIELNLKTINIKLFKLLKDVLNIDKAEMIEEKLKLFNIKTYKFSEIFKKIISNYKFNEKKSNNKRNSIKKLLSILYELYILNKGKTGIDINIPQNVSIPILNRNNGQTVVDKVYLGKEYENKLCELLYGYDSRRRICC